MLNEYPERVIVLHVPEFEAPDEATANQGTSSAEQSRRWEAVLSEIEHLVPGIEPLRPGWCAMRARGPARYYGGEAAAAAALVSHVERLGFTGAGAGVANGRFVAEQAALAENGDPGIEMPVPGVRLVAADAGARFLDRLPVARAATEDVLGPLLGLGIRTLGALAALPEASVRERFGAAGLSAHRRASGLGAVHAAEIRPRDPGREPSAERTFEPPVEEAEQLAFACSTSAERLLAELTVQGLICTELSVALTDELGAQHERAWAHPDRFTPADVLNRIRWQAGALPREPDRGGAGIVGVRLTSTRTAYADEHEPGLWSDAPDARVHHHLSRVQSLLGHDGVRTGEIVGGRLSADRQRLMVWGDAEFRSDHGNAKKRRARTPQREGPWPGRLSGPLPSAVFTAPRPAALLDREGCGVTVAAEESLSSEPIRLAVAPGDGAASALLPAPLRARSALWPLHERWWSKGGGAVSYRLQVLLEDGDAWLLRYEQTAPESMGRWVAEGHYD